MSAILGWVGENQSHQLPTRSHYLQNTCCHFHVFCSYSYHLSEIWYSWLTIYYRILDHSTLGLQPHSHCPSPFVQEKKCGDFMRLFSQCLEYREMKRDKFQGTGEKEVSSAKKKIWRRFNLNEEGTTSRCGISWDGKRNKWGHHTGIHTFESMYEMPYLNLRET